MLKNKKKENKRIKRTKDNIKWFIFRKKRKPYSLGNAFKSDIRKFFTDLPTIPGAMWGMVKESAEIPVKYYDPHDGFFGKIVGRPKTQKEKNRLKKKLLWNSINIFLPGILLDLPYMERIKILKEWKERVGWTSISSNIVNRLLLDSIIRNTGKWFYNPETRKRRWFTPLSDPFSRFQQLKEKPFTTAMEDITNIAIFADPLLRVAGLPAKMDYFVRVSKPKKLVISRATSLFIKYNRFMSILFHFKKKP